MPRVRTARGVRGPCGTGATVSWHPVPALPPYCGTGAERYPPPMRTIDTILDFAETGHQVQGHWTCGHAAPIDLERILHSGLGDLPSRALRALRCPTCGQKGPAELRVSGPIKEDLAAQKRREAAERASKVVRFKPRG